MEQFHSPEKNQEAVGFQNALVTQNVTVQGKRTSMRLEQETWEALDDICARTHMSRNDLCSLIEHKRRKTSRTSTMRAFIMAYFRTASEGVDAQWGPRGSREVVSRLLSS